MNDSSTHGTGEARLPSPTKLFFAPQVCSLAPHIVLHELGWSVDLVRVDIRKHVIPETGEDFFALTPRGYVPMLQLDDGSFLSETSVILRYLADSSGRLAPRPGSIERLRFDEAMHLVSTELHKGFAPFTIMASPSEESRAWAGDRLEKRVDLIAKAIGDRRFWFGDGFTILDAYTFWALGTYERVTKRELPESLRVYCARIAERASVRAARAAEA